MECLKTFHGDVQTSAEMSEDISWSVLRHFMEMYIQMLKSLKTFHGDVQTNAEKSDDISWRCTNKC